MMMIVIVLIVMMIDIAIILALVPVIIPIFINFCMNLKVCCKTFQTVIRNMAAVCTKLLLLKIIYTERSKCALSLPLYVCMQFHFHSNCAHAHLATTFLHTQPSVQLAIF